MPTHAFTIAKLADAAGVGVEAVRYYQRGGLLAAPKRVDGGFRQYSDDDVLRLRFIKRAQGLGFSLDEVKLLLDLSIGEHCAETRVFAEQKKQLVGEKITDLRAIQSALDKLIRACRTGKKGCGCPIIDSLSRE